MPDAGLSISEALDCLFMCRICWDFASDQVVKSRSFARERRWICLSDRVLASENW